VHIRAEQQLILISAGIAARRSALREQARRLMAEVEWSRLTETLRIRRLLPTLGPRILELGGEQVDDSFAEAVTQTIAAGRLQSTFLQLVSQRAIAALADAGISCTPLKGPLLSEALYGDPGRRLSNDIDLLVPPEQLDVAVGVVRGLGYRAPTEHVDAHGLPLLHFALAHERGDLPPVELHWRIHWYERSFAQERLLPGEGARTDEWRPAPTDELAALLLFYARDGFVDLRIASDIGAWWDLYGPTVERGILDELLTSYPSLGRVIPAALAVAEMVVGLPIEQIVGQTPRLGLRERIAVRLANPHPYASTAQLYAEMGLIDGLLMPPGDGVEFIRRQLLLPCKVLGEHDRAASTLQVRSSLAYSARVLLRCGVLGRYGLAMARLMRRPEPTDWGRQITSMRK
jgi:Uncharacterised nucleotidyltransferase